MNKKAAALGVVTSLTSAQGCPADPGSSTFSGVSTWVGDPNKKIAGQGPITLTISVAKAEADGTTVGGSAGASVSDIVSSAKVDVSSSITQTLTATTTYSASYAVPSGKLGWLQWGSFGYSYNWSYGSYNGACTWTSTMSGTAMSPTTTPGFNHS